MEERLFIDAVILEELHVVSKVAEKPVESPERSLRAVQTTGEGWSFEGFRFENGELKFDKRLLATGSERAPRGQGINLQACFQLYIDSNEGQEFVAS